VIEFISPSLAVLGEDTIELQGRTVDDGTIIWYEWVSNLNGLLGVSEDWSILHGAHLTIGTHVISFRVKDDDGHWSEPDTAELIVLPNSWQDVFVDAESGDDTNRGSELLDPFRTITHALGCVHGTEEKPVTVHVAAGLYAALGSGDFFPLIMKSWVSIIGEGPDTSILDAEGAANHVIECNGVNDLTIEGLTVTVGNADGTIWPDYCGGGICCYDNSSPTIENNTITGNSANDGGGICLVGESNFPTIIDCILWGNGDDLYDCDASYCCIEDPDEGVGNIHDDPMFVIGPLGEFYLAPESPCIDAGSQSAVEAGLSDRTTQADGTPDTGTVDMGLHYPIP